MPRIWASTENVLELLALYVSEKTKKNPFSKILFSMFLNQLVKLVFNFDLTEIYSYTGLQVGWRGKEGWEPAEACDQADVFKPADSRCINCCNHSQGQVFIAYPNESKTLVANCWFSLNINCILLFHLCCTALALKSLIFFKLHFSTTPRANRWY